MRFGLLREGLQEPDLIVTTHAVRVRPQERWDPLSRGLAFQGLEGLIRIKGLKV